MSKRNTKQSSKTDSRKKAEDITDLQDDPKLHDDDTSLDSKSYILLGLFVLTFTTLGFVLYNFPALNE